MTLSRSKEEYSLGDDVDFDQLNEQNLRSIKTVDTTEKLPNPSIDTRNLAGGPSSPSKQGDKRTPQSISLKETPDERLSRLKGEFQELKEELQSIVQKEKEIKIANPETQISMLKDVEVIQNQLANIYQNQGFARPSQTDAAHLTNEDKQLLDLQNNLKYHKAEALLIKLRDLQKSGTQGDSVVYKINAREQEETIKAENKIQNLDARISKLEPLLLNKELRGTPNLIEEVQRLRKCVEAIPSNNPDHITKKLTQLSEELDVFSQRKKNLEISDARLVKVEKLFEAYSKLQLISDNLPGVAARLECVKMIHDESGDIGDKINTLKETRSGINDGLNEGNALLNKVVELFGSNLSRIENDIKTLQSRVEKSGR